MKKGFGLLLVSFVLISSISFVSAGPVEDFASFVTQAVDGVKEGGRPVFELLFGATEQGGEGLVIQVLFFSLVLLIVYGLLDTVHIFGEKSWINWGIGAIISIIGIRFLPDGFLEAAAIPASALVAALVLGIPFILAFFLIGRVPNTLVRRALWAGFAAIVFVLWFYNWVRSDGWINWYWIYPVIILACALVFWFDGTLQKFWRGSRISRAIESTSDVEIERALARLDDLKQRLGRASNLATRKRIEKAIENQKEALNALRDI